MRYLLTLLLISASCTRTAAQLYNAGVLHIGTGIIMSSNGDFTNAATSDYLNDGEMYISGNIINDQPGMPAGRGITYINGTTAQTLGGAADFSTYSLTMNNTLGLTLSRRLAIGDGTSGVLSFVAGTITTGTAGQDVYFHPGSSYTGFDATHHIIGLVTKGGNTDFTFPIGDGTHTADLALTGLSAIADFQVLYAGSPYSTYVATAPLTAKNVFSKEWWDVQRVSGAATAKVTLKWNDARNTVNHTDPAHLVVAHFTGGSWQNAGGSSADGMGSSTGSIGPSNDIATFSPFTIGSTTVALPIVLGSFTVAGQDCHAALAWQTMIEENAAGFEIQQSQDGATYNTAAYVPAKGTPSTYATTVPQDSRQAWYRIRMIDLDGSSVYSPVAGLQLNCTSDVEKLETYPNPAATGVILATKLTSPVSRGAALLQVFDMTGKLVFSTGVQVNKGVNNFSLPTAIFSPGTYTLLIAGSGWTSPHAYFLLRRN